MRRISKRRRTNLTALHHGHYITGTEVLVRNVHPDSLSRTDRPFGQRNLGIFHDFPARAATSRGVPRIERQSPRLGVTDVSKIVSFTNGKASSEAAPACRTHQDTRIPDASSPRPSSFSEQSIPGEHTLDQRLFDLLAGRERCARSRIGD